MTSMTLDIWSDITCPWCWIGDARLDKALRQIGWRDDVLIRHRAYRLMPGQSPVPVMTVMAHKTNGDLGLARRMFEQVEGVAREEGLHFALERTIAGDTMDAHRLVKLAATTGRDHVMLETLYRAHLGEGRSIFDHAELRALALEAGLDAGAVDGVLAGTTYRDAVEADQRALEDMRVQGVPFYLVDGRRGISGAQPVAVFLDALHGARRERPVEAAAGALVCGPDGCA